MFRISPFLLHPRCSHRPFTYLERPKLEVETMVLLMPCWLAQKSEI
jgi:hypothetical protein